MAKTKTIFYCTACGNETPKWQGRCPACGAWNTMIEHAEKPTPAGRVRATSVWEGNRKPRTLSDVDIQAEIRFSTGMGELNRVLGGGAVAGSLVLVGGAPGIGKSTPVSYTHLDVYKRQVIQHLTGHLEIQKLTEVIANIL